MKRYNQEIKRHMGALSEDFQGKMKVIAEQYLSLKRDTTEVKKKLDSHTEMIEQVLVDLAEVKNDLKTKVTYNDFAKLEKRVAHLEASRR